VRDAARSLTDLGERGRIVPEINNPSIRELFVRSYRRIYQITTQAIYIIGFIHGARDLWALWKQENRPNSENVG
jgi:toxin ParE1/3/4